jgi:hypothetical protein
VLGRNSSALLQGSSMHVQGPMLSGLGSGVHSRKCSSAHEPVL